MSKRRPQRLKSFDYRGKYQSFLTCCAFDRRSTFTSPERVNCVKSQILRTCSERGFAIPAMVFMPEHVHLLVTGLDQRSHLTSCMTLARQRAAVALRGAFHERLWQDGYFDRIIRDRDDLRLTVRYIMDNPAREKLCERPEDYPYLYVLPDVRSAGL